MDDFRSKSTDEVVELLITNPNLELILDIRPAANGDGEIIYDCYLVDAESKKRFRVTTSAARKLVEREYVYLDRKEERVIVSRIEIYKNGDNSPAFLRQRIASLKRRINKLANEVDNCQVRLEHIESK